MPNSTKATSIPYGAWPSPITPDMLTGQTTGLGVPGSDGDTRYWLESRASEGGRTRLIRELPDGTREPITPSDCNVRSGVHEYGGGVWNARDGFVVVCDYTHYQVCRADNGNLSPITPPDSGFRYADMLVDPDHNRVIAVREDHRFEDAEPVNTIVVLDLDGPNEDGGVVIVSGSDFVSSPTLSADGSQLAFLSWDHPLMPWDGSELWKADISPDNTLTNLRHVAGTAKESIFQPRWDPSGDLVFVSDRSGWWNLYRARPGTDRIMPLCPMEAEFGLPQWVFGMSTWDFAPNGDIVCAWTQNGTWSVGRVPAGGGDAVPFDVPFDVIGGVQVQRETNQAIMLAASSTLPVQLIAIDLADGSWRALRRSMDVDLPEGSISVAEAISWPTPDDATAHGFYYPPTSPFVTAPEGERPPLIVKSHGGPTSATDASLDLRIQFWTSRGFAVLDVNYGGSTGFGRAYRERLNGRWGIVDVDDCISGAEHLGAIGKVDRDRLVIKGGSAGGYTTLAALTFHNVFRSGVSSYGIGDLETMAADTHKFESRYLDNLVGPYPKDKATYEERSPIHHTDLLNCAMLLFQGLDDKVVPPDQSEQMADAVRAKGLPVALMMFEGEGHGFRREETIHRTLEAELSFHSQILDFPHPQDIPRLTIENLTPDNP
jgi:dipeptidyl aminopeptidase/acylaminoacyl peptidase